MSARVAAVILALAALTIGIVLRSTAVHIAVDDGPPLSCGSVSSPQVSNAVSEATSGDLTTELLTLGGADSVFDGALAEQNADQTSGDIVSSCDSSLSTRGTWSWVLIGLGIALGVAAMIRRRTPNPAAA